jgi:hypothetical protein
LYHRRAGTAHCGPYHIPRPESLVRLHESFARKSVAAGPSPAYLG